VIARLLVANRGEIARRVIRTCRSLGISPVAVHSAPDAGGAWVGEADLSVAVDSYLDAAALLDAALRAGADAVHPGYGFLAEDAGFARAVLAAGLTWVGPPPDAIASMGSKIEAKALVAAAGVPVLPSWGPTEVPTDFPVLVKASYGGGGRGMRVVRSAAGLASAVDTAQREAAAAFGDGTVFLERWLEGARHIEVQVLADTHGTVLALGDRDCSVQRRHQKVIEEAPALLDPDLRDRLHSAAVAAARAVGYVGAGTVEFLVGDQPAFLEMNTRLQVEHPVTEAVLGIDLVALQLSVAEGAPLPFLAAPPVVGHAIEVRLCAEDPAADWRPSTGVLHRLSVPGVTSEFGFPPATPLPAGGVGLRLDSGVVDGDAVSPHYDSMLAKVVAHAPTRDAAIRLLADALARAEIAGPVTNRDLLVRVLRSPGFAAGPDTGFLAAHPSLREPLAGPAEVRTAALVAALAAAARRRAAATVLATLPAGWRNNPSQPATACFDGPYGPVEVTYRPAPGVLAATPDRVVLDDDGVRTPYRVRAVGDVSYVDGPGWSVALSDVDPLPAPADALPSGSLTAPMPGLVVAVKVAAGDRVSAGQPLLALEAMKMEHAVVAPAAGVLTELRVAAGTQVNAGDVLAVIEES
jgi:propionyl-CoA carboxylase alpha chain